MENKKDLGPQRQAAAILLLWGFLYTAVENAVTAGISMSPIGWLARLCSLGYAILLFMGKRNIGFTVFAALRVLSSLWNMIATFNIYQVLWLVADVLMLIVIIFATFSERRNPFKNLEFIPAGVYLLPSVLLLLAGTFRWFGAVYYVNALITALAWWLMARALTDYVPQQNPSAGFSTYIPTAPQMQSPAAPAHAVSSTGGPGTLLVRFSIDKLNKRSGPYGFQSGKLIGQVVPPRLLEGMTIRDGDSAATLGGREYVCIVSISTASERAALKEIENLILADEEIRECGEHPVTQIVSSTNEPLVLDGIVRNGEISGPGGWCANGFAAAWKEQQEKAVQPTQPAADAPAEAEAQWEAANPQLASNMPLSALLRVFVFTDGDGQTVLRCPVAMGTLADTVGAPVNRLTGTVPVDVIARSNVGNQIMQTGQFPDNGWTALAAIDTDKVFQAQVGELKTCIRTFRNPNTREAGAHVLLYKK